MAQRLQSSNRCLNTFILFIIRESHSRKRMTDWSWVTWGEFKRKLFTKYEQGVGHTKRETELPGTVNSQAEPWLWELYRTTLRDAPAHEDSQEGMWGIALLTAFPSSLWPPARGTTLAEPTGSQSTRGPDREAPEARADGQGVCMVWGNNKNCPAMVTAGISELPTENS